MFALVYPMASIGSLRRQEDSNAFFNICTINPTGIRLTEDERILHEPTNNRIKIDNLNILAAEEKLSVIILCETWFNDLVRDEHVSINGFNGPMRNDRLDGYGGVAVYTNNLVKATRLPEHELNSYNSICIKIEQSPTTYILAVYRPPNSASTFQTFLEELEAGIRQINNVMKPHDVLMIAGDFNVHCNDWFRTKQPTRLGDNLKSLLDAHVLTQMIRHHSYERGTSYKSLLDLMITNQPDRFVSSECKAPLLGNTTYHHNPVVSKFVINSTKKNRSEAYYISVREANTRKSFNHEQSTTI